MPTTGPFGATFDAGTTLGLGPAELLGRFGATRDEAAFAALVARHGPMVLATCRRILPDPADADDAFQATFLVLARKAGTIGDPDRLAPWLHGVARRVSVKARARAARRRAIEGAGAEVAAPASHPADDHADLRAVLDEELARLPEKYRTPLVLCYLDGLTHDQAAGQLGWPVGTVRSRLAGGRDRLRSRLARRGYGAAGALAPVPPAAVPPSLIRAAARSALGAGAAPASVLSLARGVTLAMTLTSPKSLAIVAVALLGAALGGAATLARPNQDPPGPRPAPAAIAAELPAPPRPPVRRVLPELFPLTVTGRALDQDGGPIAGARIFLASCSYGALGRLAATTTDAAGAYRFDAVLLPIRPDGFDAKGPPARGYFEVFGMADGFGLARRPRKEIALPQANLIRPAPVDPPDWYQPDDPIVLDLAFPPPARLAGRVTDEAGRPLAGAAIRINSWDRADATELHGGTEFASIDAADLVPHELTRCSTDAAGNFALDGLPPGTRFGLVVRPRGFPERWILAATAAGPQPDLQGRAVYTGPIDLAFVTPREFPFRVVAGDTGLPAPQALFSVGGAVGDGGVAEADGRGTLALPPGEYAYEILPALGTPYLVTKGKLAVPADGPVPAFEARLRPAVVLDVAVVDADTGAPLADVDLWEAPPDGPVRGQQRLLLFRSYEAATRTCHVERPRTGADGKLRALVEPGPRRVGVGLETYPGGRQAIESDGQPIDGQPGETIRLTFPMRRYRPH